MSELTLVLTPSPSTDTARGTAERFGFTLSWEATRACGGAWTVWIPPGQQPDGAEVFEIVSQGDWPALQTSIRRTLARTGTP